MGRGFDDFIFFGGGLNLAQSNDAQINEFERFEESLTTLNTFYWVPWYITKR